MARRCCGNWSNRRRIDRGFSRMNADWVWGAMNNRARFVSCYVQSPDLAPRWLGCERFQLAVRPWSLAPAARNMYSHGLQPVVSIEKRAQVAERRLNPGRNEDRIQFRV